MSSPPAPSAGPQTGQPDRVARGAGATATGSFQADRRPLRRAQLLVLAVLAAYTAATVAYPALRLSSFAPELRLVIEVAGLCFVLLAALVLAFPSADDVGPARSAFIAALCVMALTNAAFSLGPALYGGGLGLETGLGFYPWIASRYLAGLLFICATVERPRLGIVPFLLLALGALAIADAALAVLGDRLPLPFRVRVDEAAPAVEVTLSWGHAATQAVPGALFALGGWLAGRLYLRSAAPAYWWLSLALVVQMFTHVHEALYPAMLGPIITSADLLRFLAFVLLLTGALCQIRVLYRARLAAVQIQDEDLHSQQVLLDELRAFAEREEDFRALVSHELATPLATLRAFAHVLSGHADETVPDPMRQAIHGVGTETRRLQELVARMEELRELEHAEFRCDLRPVRVRSLVDDAARFAKALPGGHPVYVRCDDVRVDADPVRLGQALRNVLANAARYSPAGSPVTIECVTGGPDRVRIVVADEGPGVPVAERRRVLGKYGRGTQAGRSEG
ncbi:MAG: HAMP domain-containing histidine kinase, partial [Actinomycetota bacterium]|nr:HAMP domain-containing histidine kinase [Actinomycetota bacterium]